MTGRRGASEDTSRLLNRLHQRFVPLDISGGDSNIQPPGTSTTSEDPFAPGLEETVPILTNIIPTVIVVASDAAAWLVEAGELSDFNEQEGWYVCDGSQDSIEILAANDDLPGAGGRILFTEGLFNVDPGIMSFNDDVHLVGMGTGTIIRGSAGGTLLAMGDGGTVTDMRVEGGGVSTGITLGARGVVDRVQFDDLLIGVGDLGNGSRIVNCWGNALVDFINDTGNPTGVVVANNSVDGDIVLEASESSIHGNILGDLVIAGSSSHLNVIGNYCKNISTSGAAKSHLVIVSNRVQDGANQNGIDLADVTDSIIAHNLLDPDRHGIRLVTCSRNIVTGNLISEPGSDGANTYDGMVLEGISDENYLHGNRVRAGASTPRYGINVQTGDDNIVVENDLGAATDYGTSAIKDTGLRTRLVYPNHSIWGDNFVLDSSGGSGALFQGFADDVGVTDSVSIQLSDATLTITDDVGVTDLVVVAHNQALTEIITEPVGMTDSQVVSFEVQSNVDSVGVTDSVTFVLA